MTDFPPVTYRMKTKDDEPFSVNGVAFDPPDVLLKYGSPSGVTYSKTLGAGEVIRDGVGLYHYDALINEAGVWHYAFSCTGTAVVTQEGEFEITAVHFAFP